MRVASMACALYRQERILVVSTGAPDVNLKKKLKALSVFTNHCSVNRCDRDGDNEEIKLVV